MAKTLGIVKLQASAESGRLKDEAIANQRLGRLSQRYWRSATAFSVKIKPILQPKD